MSTETRIQYITVSSYHTCYNSVRCTERYHRDSMTAFDDSVDFTSIPNLSEDDKQFLEDMFQRFPRVLEGYQLFTNMDPMQRVRHAAQTLQSQARTGWVLRFDALPDRFRPILHEVFGEVYDGGDFITRASAPSTESVLEHSAEAGDLAAKLYRHTKPPAHAQWLNEIMKFHDFHEAIDGDFTPRCAITREEKKRLEGISTELLFASKELGDVVAQHAYYMTQIFEGHATPLAAMKPTMMDTLHKASRDAAPHQQPTIDFFTKLYQSAPDSIDQSYTKRFASKAAPTLLDLTLLQEQAKDIDALHMLVRATRMVKEHHIAPENAHKLDDFWDYTEKKITTPEAKSFFNALKKAASQEAISYPQALDIALRAASPFNGIAKT
jgi:5'-deoxynucleotidase YfbR-like HD superfamily hydrolase